MSLRRWLSISDETAATFVAGYEVSESVAQWLCPCRQATARSQAGIRAILSQHDYPLHFCQRQADASRLQDEVDVMDDLGSEDAVSSVSSARSGQQADPFPEPQRLRRDACALREG